LLSTFSTSYILLNALLIKNSQLFPHGSRSSDLIALDQAYQEQFANRLTFTIPAQAIALRTSGKIVINYIAPALLPCIT